MENITITMTNKDGSGDCTETRAPSTLVDYIDFDGVATKLCNFCRKNQGVTKGSKINKALKLEKDVFKNNSKYIIGKVAFMSKEDSYYSLIDKENNSIFVVNNYGDIMEYNKPIDVEDTPYPLDFTEKETKENWFFEGGDHYIRLDSSNNIHLVGMKK